MKRNQPGPLVEREPPDFSMVAKRERKTATTKKKSNLRNCSRSETKGDAHVRYMQAELDEAKAPISAAADDDSADDEDDDQIEGDNAQYEGQCVYRDNIEAGMLYLNWITAVECGETDLDGEGWIDRGLDDHEDTFLDRIWPELSEAEREGVNLRYAGYGQ